MSVYFLVGIKFFPNNFEFRKLDISLFLKGSHTLFDYIFCLYI